MCVFLLADVLILGCVVSIGCKAPAPVVEPVRSRGLAINFQREPEAATVAALRGCGAVQARPLMWTLQAYDWRNGSQAQAVHAALAEGAHLGPL